MEEEPRHVGFSKSTPSLPFHLFSTGKPRQYFDCVIKVGSLEKNGERHSAHVIVECRGKSEDDELELEFRRLCGGAPFTTSKVKLEVVFAAKKSNAVGLQLAELMARPIGMSVLKPDQANRAVDALRPKLMTVNGKTTGRGLKCFP